MVVAAAAVARDLVPFSSVNRASKAKKADAVVEAVALGLSGSSGKGSGGQSLEKTRRAETTFRLRRMRQVDI